MTTNHKSAPAAPAAPAPAKMVEFTDVQMVTVDELGHVRKHVKVLKAREVELATEVKGWVRGTGGGTYDGVLKASVSDRAGRRVVDFARLAKDFPDAYAACVSLGNAAEVLILH